MKKKLLITLGCSYTEGVGCYEPSLLNERRKPLDKTISPYNASTDRFHVMGWPHQLQKKLGYHYLWNLGHGGCSNSETVKRWMELFSDRNLSDEYDVLVIWMVTFSTRISFYRNGKISSVLSHVTNMTPEYQNLSDSYFNFLGNNPTRDVVLESYFYVNLIKNICTLSNYKFFYINVNADEGRGLDVLMKNSASLNFTHKILYPEHRDILHEVRANKDLDTVAFCGHPNEKGYAIITERLFNLISYEHSYLINKTPPEKYENKHLGVPKQW
jgi:hypothetical protein